MKNKLFANTLFFCLCVFSFQANAQNTNTQSSICNPLNLNYRFRLEEPSRREAADPTIISYKEGYLMFASKSGGYWYSTDLISWEFIETNEIPTEEYAPTAIEIKDTVYFLASNFFKSKIYKSSDLLSGKWSIAKDTSELSIFDPAFYMDDDNKLYLYWGCSNFKPIYGVEVDYQNNFSAIAAPVELLYGNPKKNGWERVAEYNDYTGRRKPFIEGAWVTKHKGKYYLQYSSPATDFKSYSDGVYVSDSPLGPFTIADSNPFSYKPEGFIGGAGHGSTFQDKYGNYWHAASMSVTVKDNYERRIGLFPAFFDEDGVFHTYTAYGDFPHIIPQKLMKGAEDYQPAWMLLSYNKPVEVSSALVKHPKENTTDENIRKYWSAQTGNKGEWMIIDLLNKCKLSAVQVNFAEEGFSILGRTDSIFYQYLVEYSKDKINWKTLIDKTANIEDCPHDYVELLSSVSARYIRLTNYRVPDGKFAVSGLRIFGKGNGKAPKQISDFTVTRDSLDTRNVTLSWQKPANVTGCNIRYGVAPDKLYLNYQVFDTDTLTIHSLSTLQDYYFTIDGFNENGITQGKKVFKAAK